MKEDYEIVVEREERDDEAPVREKIVVGRMRWNPNNPPGDLMTDESLTLHHSVDGNGWVEDTEKQKTCGYWTADNPHPFNDGSVCTLCGARRSS